MATRRWSRGSDRLELGTADAFVIGEEILDDYRGEQAEPRHRTDGHATMPSEDAVQAREAPLVAAAEQSRRHLRRLVPPAALVAVGVSVLLASSLLRQGSSTETSTERGRLARVQPDERQATNGREAAHAQEGGRERNVRPEPSSNQGQPSRPLGNTGRPEGPAGAAQSAPVGVGPHSVGATPPTVQAAPVPVTPAGQTSADPGAMSRQEIIAREFGP